MKKNIFKRGSLILVIILLMMTVLTACSSDETIQSNNIKEPLSKDEKLIVHFIDVGQADSILIQNKDESMLIDGGNNGDSDLVIDYIRKQGIKKLDYVVGTHPHEDHIGGLDAVIDSFDIGKIIMPKVTHTTKTFKDVITAIKNKKLKISTPRVGDKFKIGDAEAVILGPNSEKYEDFNNYSVVLRITYKDTSYLFTGDAEELSEKEILSNGLNISADVLKLGHHGSHTSTSEEFLNKVSPKYGVITCGKDNDYGHPHRETIEKLKKSKVAIYRTDESGTIISTSDGKNIDFNVNLGSYLYGDDSKTVEKNYNDLKPDKPEGKKIKFSAVIDNPAPSKNSTVNLLVNGPAGGEFEATLHYKSKDTVYTGSLDNEGKAFLPIKIGRAASGFKVIIDVNISYNGESYKTSTSFIPQ